MKLHLSGLSKIKNRFVLNKAAKSVQNETNETHT